MVRVLMISPAPPTPLKARLYRFALELAPRVDLHIIFMEEAVGSRVPPTVRLTALDELRRAGVTLHALGWPMLTYCSAASSVLRGFSARESLFRQEHLRAQVGDIHDAVKPDVIHVDRARTAYLVAKINTPAIIDFTDPIGWYLSQRARQSSGLVRLILAEESKRKWQLEKLLAQSGRVICFASEFGASTFLARHPQTRACVVPNPLPVLVGSSAGRMPLEGTSPRLGFWGNLSYSPNIDALKRFTTDAWPIVRKRLPSATLHIAGCSPGTQIRRLAKHDGIYIYPDPPEMGAFASACDIAISPLHLCAGYPNKIAEAAVQAELPVVATTQACEGLPREIRNEIVVARTHDGWAEEISRLWTSEDRGRRIARRLRLLFETHLNSGIVMERLLRAYDQAREGPAKVRALEAVSDAGTES